MDYEPQPSTERYEYLPDELRGNAFNYARIAAMEDMKRLNLGLDEYEQLREDHAESLNSAFGEKYEGQLADIIAHAYMADANEVLTGEDDVVSLMDVVFEYVTIINVGDEPTIVFQFRDSHTDDGVEVEDVYFVEPDDFLKLDIESVDATSEPLRDILGAYANAAHEMMADNETTAEGFTQLCYEVSDEVLRRYRHRAVTVDSAGFYFMRDGEPYDLKRDYVNQVGIDYEKRIPVQGYIVDFDHPETFQYSGRFTVFDISHGMPSIVVRSEAHGYTYLVPIDCFQSCDELDGDE